MEWQTIDSAPKNKAILIFYKNCMGNGRTIKAIYFPKFTSECADDYATGEWEEYDEQTGTSYVPEGWYECIDNWDELANVALEPYNVPSHWMPLPEPPKAD